MEKSGLHLNEMDIIEINEAFRNTSIACDREIHLDPKKLNVNGGAISYGNIL